MLSRRSVFIRALFALAMPAQLDCQRSRMSRLHGAPKHIPKPDTLTVFDERGNAWTVPIQDGKARMIASRPMTVMPFGNATISGRPVRTVLEAITGLQMEHGDTLTVSGLLPPMVHLGCI